MGGKGVDPVHYRCNLTIELSDGAAKTLSSRRIAFSEDLSTLSIEDFGAVPIKGCVESVNNGKGLGKSGQLALQFRPKHDFSTLTMTFLGKPATALIYKLAAMSRPRTASARTDVKSSTRQMSTSISRRDDRIDKPTPRATGKRLKSAFQPLNSLRPRDAPRSNPLTKRAYMSPHGSPDLSSYPHHKRVVASAPAGDRARNMAALRDGPSPVRDLSAAFDDELDRDGAARDAKGRARRDRDRSIFDPPSDSDPDERPVQTKRVYQRRPTASSARVAMPPVRCFGDKLKAQAQSSVVGQIKPKGRQTRTALNASLLADDDDEPFVARRPLLLPGRRSYPPPDKQPDEASVVGLTNTGNSCYVNAVVQCYLSVHELMSALRTADAGPDTVVGALRELERPADAIKVPQPASNAKTVKWAVAENNEAFKGKTQQDAHEFQMALLDEIEGDLGSAVPLRQALGSHVSTGVACSACPYRSTNEAVYLEFNLEIVGSSPTVPRMLKSHFESVHVDDFRCEDGCGKRAAAELVREITVLPPVVVITLKRFAMDNYGTISKVKAPVSVPQTVDFSPFVRKGAVDRAECKYEIFAMVNHLGETRDSGHYTATLKDPATGKWLEVDDSFVCEATHVTGPSVQAYILFYRRVSA